MRARISVPACCAPSSATSNHVLVGDGSDDDERVARRILAHLGLPSRAPPRPPPSGQPLLPLAALPDLEGIDPPLILD